MSRQLKVQSLVRVRVSTPLQTQLLKWSARAALSETDFLRFALVLGARTLALNLGLHRPEDDLEIQDMEVFRFRGAELPAELDRGQQKYFLNPTGRIPSDAELEASWASEKARLEKKRT
ncbi:MAG: hypothetical protein WD751_03175 [Anaerolineales bacterium]